MLNTAVLSSSIRNATNKIGYSCSLIVFLKSHFVFIFRLIFLVV